MSKNKILKTVSDYQPAGDQPQAITEIVKNISKKELDQVLLGVTGSGKTFTMAKIIDYCELNIGIKVVLTASSDNFEIEKVKKIISLTKSKPINLAGKLSLKETVALNKKSKLFIGVDTSIMHVSASNNIPVLAFFCPSGAFNWGPWDNSLLLSGYKKSKGIQVMGIHRVFSESRLCQPCGQDGCDGSKISQCLMTLDINEIKKNIQEMYSAQEY